MIASAYGPPPGCTCQDPRHFGAHCPRHGADLPGAKPGAVPGPLPQAAPATEGADYARGRAAGFREGLELALKFVMALGAQ